MQIHGPTFVHGPQSIGAPHRSYAPRSAPNAGGFSGVDQLDISPEAERLSQSREGFRSERVAEIRAQIAEGSYDSDEKLSVALDRLMDDLSA